MSTLTVEFRLDWTVIDPSVEIIEVSVSSNRSLGPGRTPQWSEGQFPRTGREGTARVCT